MGIDKNYKTSSSKIGWVGKTVIAGLFYGLYSIFGGNYSAQASEKHIPEQSTAQVRTELNYTGKTLANLLGTDEFEDKTYVPAFVVSKDWAGDSKWKIAEAVDYKIGDKTGKLTNATLSELTELMGGSVKYLKTGENFADATVIFNKDVPAYLDIKTKKGLVPAIIIGDGSNKFVRDGKGEIIGYQWFPEGKEHGVLKIKWKKPGSFGANLWTPADMKSGSLGDIFSKRDLKNSSVIFYRGKIKGDEPVNSGELVYMIIRPQEQMGSKVNEFVEINPNPNHQTIRIGKPRLSEKDGGGSESVAVDQGGNDGDGPCSGTGR